MANYDADKKNGVSRADAGAAIPVSQFTVLEKDPGGGGPEEEVERGNWASKTEFILSCLGYAIGIGNVWRFPYLAYRNGGGAFLVPYLIMLFFCGIPLFFMETVLGQFSSTGCITLFRINPLFKGAGYAIVVVNILTTVYYNVILAYPLYFLAMCFRKVLPWEDCNNSWNTEACLKLGDASSVYNQSVQTLITKTPADEFFHNGILDISDGIGTMGGLVWPLVACNVVSWVIMVACIINGVRSVGKVVYFTATFPYIIMFVLLVRGLTLPGAIDGALYYITPQWDKLATFKVWADAAVQLFFSLGPGWGGIVNMSSYNKFRNNTKWDSILVPTVNVATSIMCGFVVFTVLGYMSFKTGVPIDRVATGGPGLSFVTYPEAINLLPWPHLWAVLFFVMLYLLGMDSLFVQIEAIVSSVTDEYVSLRKRKRTVVIVSCFIMFLGSLFCVTQGGIYVLTMLDWYCASITVILVCLLEILTVGWIYGLKAFVRDIEYMIGEKVHWWWKICWQYISPAILFCMFLTSIAFNTPVTYNGIVYPAWGIALGWTAAASSLVLIPAYMIYKLAVTPGKTLMQRLRTSVRATDDWGPALPADRAGWEAFKAGPTPTTAVSS